MKYIQYYNITRQGCSIKLRLQDTDPVSTILSDDTRHQVKCKTEIFITTVASCYLDSDNISQVPSLPLLTLMPTCTRTKELFKLTIPSSQGQVPQWLCLLQILQAWECLSRHWVGFSQALGSLQKINLLNYKNLLYIHSLVSSTQQDITAAVMQVYQYPIIYRGIVELSERWYRYCLFDLKPQTYSQPEYINMPTLPTQVYMCTETCNLIRNPHTFLFSSEHTHTHTHTQATCSESVSVFIARYPLTSIHMVYHRHAAMIHSLPVTRKHVQAFSERLGRRGGNLKFCKYSAPCLIYMYMHRILPLGKYFQFKGSCLLTLLQLMDCLAGIHCTATK